MDAGSSLTPGSFDMGMVVDDEARFGLGSRATLCGETERWRACQRGGQSREEGPRGAGCGLLAAGETRTRCGEGGNEGGGGGGRWRRSRRLGR